MDSLSVSHTHTQFVCLYLLFPDRVWASLKPHTPLPWRTSVSVDSYGAVLLGDQGTPIKSGGGRWYKTVFSFCECGGQVFYSRCFTRSKISIARSRPVCVVRLYWMNMWLNKISDGICSELHWPSFQSFLPVAADKIVTKHGRHGVSWLLVPSLKRRGLFLVVVAVVVVFLAIFRSSQSRGLTALAAEVLAWQ